MLRSGMDYDWDTPARLDSYHVINQAHIQPVAVEGTLRQCLEAVAEWPTSAVPIIYLDRPVAGRTVLDQDDILALLRELQQR